MGHNSSASGADQGLIFILWILIRKDFEFVAFKAGQYFAGGREHWWRQPRETRDFDAVRLRSAAAFELVQKHHFTFALGGRDLIVLRAR